MCVIVSTSVVITLLSYGYCRIRSYLEGLLGFCKSFMLIITDIQALFQVFFLVVIKLITKYFWYMIDVKSYSIAMIIFKYMITNVIILKPQPVLLYKITVHCIHGIFIVFWCSSQTQIVRWIKIWDWSKSMTTEKVGGCVFWRVCVCIFI